MKDIALALSSGGVRGQTHIGVIEELESQGYRTIKAIMEFVPDVPIEDLPIAYCAVATDWITGRKVVIDKGRNKAQKSLRN